MTGVPFRNSDEPEPLPLDAPFQVPDGFAFTWCRWNYTERKGGKDRDGHAVVKYIKKFALEGSVDSYEFGTCQEFPAGMDSQPGLICSRKARFMVVECDDPEAFQAELLLGNAVPTVRSARGYHYYFAVPENLVDYMPTDGPVSGGDVQTAGFVPAPGSTHPSGAVYELVSDHVNVADARLLGRLTAARAGQNEKLRQSYKERGGTGDWEPSGINGQDDYLAKEICWTLVAGGRSEAEVRRAWEAEAAKLPLADPGDPFTEEDFQRHYRGAVRKYEELAEAGLTGAQISPLLAAWVSSRAQADEPEAGKSFVPPGYTIPPGFTLNESGVWRRPPQRGKQPPADELIIHRPMIITRRMLDAAGGHQYELTWSNPDGTTDCVLAAAPEIAHHLKLLQVLPGLMISSRGSSWASEYLVACANVNAAWLEEHSVNVATTLGWYGDGTDEFVYGHGHPCEVRDVYNLGRWLDGHVQAGTLDTWVAAMERAPWRVLVMVAGALAAPLLRILKEPGFVVDNSDETTRGKTRAARAAASVWGDPDRLLLSWSDTKVALERHAAVARGVPVVVDDSKLARDGKQIADLVYQVTSGLSAGKAERNGARLQDRLEIETVMITNGESALLAQSGRYDGGAAARVVAVHGAPFATAGDADMLDAVISGHYGHAGEVFVTYLLTLDSRCLQDRYHIVREATQAACTTDVARRRAAALAVVRLAADLAQEAGLLPQIPGEAWGESANQAAGEEGIDDLPLHALEMLLTRAVAEPGLFWNSKSGKAQGSWLAVQGLVPRGGWAGRLEKGDGWLAVRPDWLKKFLEEEKLEYEAIIRSWAQRGWLILDSKGRKTTAVWMADGNVRLHKIAYETAGTGFLETAFRGAEEL